MTERIQMDQERLEELTGAIFELIKANYERGPLGQERVYENLNALAVCAGVTIQGTESETLEWFLQAVRSSSGERVTPEFGNS